jgi:hypothetical protein
MKLRLYLLGLPLLAIAALCSSQALNLIEHFFLALQDGKVKLEWEMPEGQMCAGIKVFRSTDRLNYIEIGSISGVCGSSVQRQTLTFIDDNPINKSTNFYKLKLGNIGYGPLDSVYVHSLGEKPFEIVNNAERSQVTIYFRNYKGDKMRISIIQVIGAYSKVYTTNSNFITIDTRELSKNLFAFEIVNSRTKETFKGKFSNF